MRQAPLLTKPFWTSRCIDLAGTSFRFSVERPEQRDAVIVETASFADGADSEPVEVEWRAAPLDLSTVQFIRGESTRQVALHPIGLAVDRAPLTAICDGNEVKIGGTDPDPDSLLEAFGSVFTVGLTYALAQRHVFPLHGAAIAREGDALLLLGKPGQGKSSAVWGAFQAGFDLLGDDTVFVRPGQAGPQISGMRKPVAVPAEVLDQLPRGANQNRIHGGSRNRWEIPPDMIAPDWHRLRGVLTPVHGSAAEGALTPRTRTDLLGLAVGAYYASAHESQLAPWFPHAAAVCRLPAWDLHHSPQVDRRLEAAAHWLGIALDEATT